MPSMKVDTRVCSAWYKYSFFRYCHFYDVHNVYTSLCILCLIDNPYFICFMLYRSYFVRLLSQELAMYKRLIIKKLIILIFPEKGIYIRSE